MKRWLLEHQQLLTRQIQQQQLPHAMLIVGAELAGKKELSSWLVDVLSCQQPILNSTDNVLSRCKQCKCCQLMNSNTYPDHMLLHAETKSLGVDEIRTSNQFFQKTAQIGNYQSLVIEQANNMTVAAANALLKTLEEPTQQSVIILLSDDIERLLPTIISRCRIYTLKPPIGRDLLDELSATGDHAFANLTHFAELSDKNTAEQFNEFQQIFIHYLITGEERTTLLNLLQTSQYSLRWIEKILVNVMREQSAWSSNENKLYSDPTIIHNKEKLWDINEKFLTFRKKLKQLSQANQQFEFEKFLVDIKSIIRTS